MAYTHTVVPIDQVRPHPRNPRTHTKKQIRQIAASIRAVGFAAPVLIDENKILIAGHGRLDAAKSLGMSSIPAIVISGLSDAKKRALLLADNRIALSAGWNRELLTIELAALPDLLVEDDLDISVTGFEPGEIDALHADFEDGSNDILGRSGAGKKSGASHKDSLAFFAITSPSVHSGAKT
jgi:ParB-like chromosome segregation protein Spo0J